MDEIYCKKSSYLFNKKISPAKGYSENLVTRTSLPFTPLLFSASSGSVRLLQVFTLSLWRLEYKELLNWSHSTHKLPPLDDYSPVQPRRSARRPPSRQMQSEWIIKSASLKSLVGTNGSVSFNVGYIRSNNMFLIRHLFN